MKRFILTFSATIAMASAALAHEGHGHPAHQEGVTHYVVNPSHAVPVILAIAIATGVGVLIRRGRRA